MKKSKKNSTQAAPIKMICGNENGSVLLVTVIMLLILTLIGISGINTASTDLQITRNYKIHQQNLVLAEAAGNYAMTMVERALDENIAGKSWVEDKAWKGVYLAEDLKDAGDKYFKDGSGYNPRGNDPIANQLDVQAVAEDWNSITDITPEPLSSEPETEYLAFIQIEEGAELAKRVTSAVVIARCQRSGGDVVIEQGVVYSD